MDRRYERLGCAALALLGAAGSIAFAFFLPEPPEAPRWMRAGAQTPQVGGTFVFHHEANVRSLDPHVAYDELSGMAIRLMFDGLLDYDHESNLVPSLAEAMPVVSEDGRTFRFRLRRGVRFHPMAGHLDGRELVAEDVRWSMLRLMSQEVGSPGYPFYASIEGADAYHEGRANDVAGIRVIDRYTIELQLKEADQTFLNAMAMPFAYPVPRENYEHWGDEVKFHPVGTGPFVFEAWERGVQLTFTRNERYWRDKPGPERMLYLENIGRELAAQRFRNGDIDSIHRQSPSDYRFFKTSEAWRPYMVEEPRGSTYGLGFNCEMAPFDDVHVRRAIAFALDREGWSRARAGRLLPASQLLPPSIPGYDPELPTRQVFDLDRAREEMRLAGHPNGLPEPITVWITGQDDTSRQYGELLQADLARIGIDVRLRFVSFAVYLTESGKPNTVPAFFTGWNLDFPDPSNFLFLFDQKSIHPEHSENRSFYRNPEVDRLLAEGKSERDRERRLGLYRQANEIVARDAPWAFLYYTLTMELWQPYVRNYDPHPVWSEDYREVWLDLPRERVARSLAGVGRPVPARFYPMGALR